MRLDIFTCPCATWVEREDAENEKRTEQKIFIQCISEMEYFLVRNWFSCSTDEWHMNICKTKANHISVLCNASSFNENTVESH